MSSEVPKVRLGEHVEACLGKMLDAKKNKGTPQPYLGNSNVRWGVFDLADLSEMRFEPHEEERYSLRPGDLVVCEGGEPGRCAIWTGPAGMKVQKALHRIRPKGSLDTHYLFYWFQLAAKSGWLEPHFTGTTIKHLTGKAIASMEVPLPSIGAQRSMVDVLRTLDDRIALLRETNATLEAVAQALFKSWFVDFDPVRARMEGRPPEGMDDATAALFPDSFEETEIGLVPKGWRVGRVENLCSIITNGGTPSRSNKKFWDKGTIPWFKTGDFNDGFLVTPAERITDEALKGSSAKLLPENAVLMAIYAAPTVGRLGVLTEPATFNQACTGMVAADQFGTWFLYWTLYFGRGWFNNRANGAAQQNISKAIVASYRSILPAEKVLAAYNDVASSLHLRIRACSEKAQTLATLRDTLLPRLISGQLRLPDAEAMAAETA
jgi:type I restriction enzyme S subunit